MEVWYFFWLKENSYFNVSPRGSLTPKCLVVKPICRFLGAHKLWYDVLFSVSLVGLFIILFLGFWAVMEQLLDYQRLPHHWFYSPGVCVLKCSRADLVGIGDQESWTHWNENRFSCLTNKILSRELCFSRAGSINQYELFGSYRNELWSSSWVDSVWRKGNTTNKNQSRWWWLHQSC